jgi:GAF domain-containing protein
LRGPGPVESPTMGRADAAKGTDLVDSEKLARTFVELADNLIDDFDALGLLTVLVERSVDVLGVAASGLLIADGQDQMRLLASSAESARLLELYQIQNDEGPCLECYRSGQPVSIGSMEEASSRWPRFAEAASSLGFVGLLALPLRLRGHVIGALNLFDADGVLFDPRTHPVAQAMADVATIAILQERLGKQQEVLNEQLQSALTNRVVIEQAKGVLAARLDIGMDEAFERLRKRSRDDRRRLVEVAEELVNARSDDVLLSYSDPR